MSSCIDRGGPRWGGLRGAWRGRAAYPPHSSRGMRTPEGERGRGGEGRRGWGGRIGEGEGGGRGDNGRGEGEGRREARDNTRRKAWARAGAGRKGARHEVRRRITGGVAPGAGVPTCRTLAALAHTPALPPTLSPPATHTHTLSLSPSRLSLAPSPSLQGVGLHSTCTPSSEGYGSAEGVTSACHCLRGARPSDR